ncbi:MAG: hypothetical protein AVDCRST_MAG33-1914 [uncultured Thermomicrobiales bacterium]|uniref:Uncharacterized protein n=1 Tax=uncultured Thermomicrobiales bacterium TaxID=1645740 RepID=A0A6J4V0V4_9BACT|nr:MAG: hypothetical protein AVDCRST_MAG33-1914 [uncultured Thermomicrobiales bacterium]
MSSRAARYLFRLPGGNETTEGDAMVLRRSPTPTGGDLIPDRWVRVADPFSRGECFAESTSIVDRARLSAME